MLIFLIRFALPIIIMFALIIATRIFIDRKIAQRNAEIEYENRKQAYKDAIRELEQEKRE